MSKQKHIKWDIKKVRKLFKDNGCELLEEVYINYTTKMRYRCSCKYKTEAEITLSYFRRGRRCKKCGIERRVEERRYSYKDVKKIFRKGGCRLISKKYKNNKQLLYYRCSCKNFAKISLNHFQKGVRCKKCGIEKNSGKNHYRYNHNLTDKDRQDRRLDKKSIEWRKKVYKRDDFICHICGKRGGDLVAHHLESHNSNKELRLVVSNGVTMSKELHLLFHKIYGKGNNTTAQFKEFQKNYQQNLLNIEV